jgi:hypothetical protein
MSDKQNTKDAANSLSELINDNKKYIESGGGWGNPESDQVAAAKHRIRGLILVFEIFLKKLVNENTALRTQLADATRKLEEARKDAESGVSLGEGMVSLQKDELLEFKSQRIFDLLQERDDLLLNAERYWWLRDQHWFESEATFRLSLSESQFANEYHDKLNAAIDQAIEQGKGGDEV